MNRLISHIEFLLHDHNCVIIPDFGGFVVNTVPSRRDGVADFHPSVCELVFNSDLTHNDGLLAQSYMKNSSMTFESAMQKVEQDVLLLKRQVREQCHVDMGKLGSFDLYEGMRFVFTPGTFVRPSLFGLTLATLKPLIQMQPVVTTHAMQNKQRWSRNVAIASAAVAVVFLMMFILPVSDTSVARQSAQMLSEAGWMQSKTMHSGNNNVAMVKVDPNVTEELPEFSLPESHTDMPTTEEVVQSTTDNLPRYYIVMGVYRGIESAQKTTELLLDKGFRQTGRLERPGRIDVYAASFSDEMAAKVYLKEIHKDFPEHTDAWILKR